MTDSERGCQGLMAPHWAAELGSPGEGDVGCSARALRDDVRHPPGSPGHCRGKCNAAGSSGCSPEMSGVRSGPIRVTFKELSPSDLLFFTPAALLA